MDLQDPPPIRELPTSGANLHWCWTREGSGKFLDGGSRFGESPRAYGRLKWEHGLLEDEISLEHVL